MTTPTKSEIHKKAIELYLADNPEANTPEEYELKEGGHWEKAKNLLMKAITPELEKELEERYQVLVSDCIEIMKKIRKASEDVVRYWHELGTRILEDDNYKIGKWGSGVFIKRLAEDIGINKSTIYSAIHFAKSFPDLKKCLTNQKLSPLTWSYIVHNLLYEPKPKLEVTPKPSSVPDVELEKPKFDIADALLKLADNVKNPSRRKMLQRFLMEAVFKFELSEEYHRRTLDFVRTQTAKEIADVSFSINLEPKRVVTQIFGYREQDSQEHKTVKASFTGFLRI
jgi:hypothetical protein